MTEFQGTVVNGVLTIRCTEKFNYNSNRPFVDAYKGRIQDPEVKSVVIDLSVTEYVDSSALGMLLMVRERCLEFAKPVSIVGAKNNVETVLKIANFPKLFQINKL